METKELFQLAQPGNGTRMNVIARGDHKLRQQTSRGSDIEKRIRTNAKADE